MTTMEELQPAFMLESLRAAAAATLLQQTYTSEGMEYSTGGLMGNTRNAHRLMAWAAAEHGDLKQHELAEQLFHGYHSKVPRS